MKQTKPSPLTFDQQPKVHGLHLATDETVTDAWELFFSACWDAWEIVQKRRAEKQVEQSQECSMSRESTPNTKTA
jgi:hypothetical protein